MVQMVCHVPLFWLVLWPLMCTGEHQCERCSPDSNAEELDDAVILMQSIDTSLKTRLSQTVARQGSQVEPQKFVAEFIAMSLFVFIGCGSAMSIAKEPGSAWVLQVSMTFGLAITVLACALGKYSGAQINCAVTLGLVIHGDVTVLQGLSNFAAQLVGAVFGALVLKVMYPTEKDLTGGLGCNSVGDGWSRMGALIGEFVGTFLLMYVVFETAINPNASINGSMAPLAIGLAVFLAHSVLIPVDGCSINPTRSFGPAFVQALFSKDKDATPFKDMWIFWFGPCLGAAAAAGVYSLMKL